VRIWLMAARPRTLPAALAPVLVGTALGAEHGRFRPLAFAAALVGAVLIQVGTNLSNDYSDARRGADTEDRLGPVRVTAGGLVPPRQVLVATWVTFGLAVLVGLELFVFAFFGLVAVTGSYFVQTERLAWEAFAVAVPVGMLAAAILMVNNIRDRETDARAGKRTLAVRLGAQRARALYAAMVFGAYVVLPVTWLAGKEEAWVLLPVLTLPLAFRLTGEVSRRTDGPSLNAALARTGLLQLAFCVLLSAGVLLSGR
jgi:1,4-dihydroxy-2-naphthoate octaprenyltransferase